MLARLKIAKMYLFGTMSLASGSFLVPVTAIIYWIWGLNDGTTIIVWILLLVAMIPVAIGFMGCLPVIGTMQSNATAPEVYLFHVR